MTASGRHGWPPFPSAPSFGGQGPWDRPTPWQFHRGSVGPVPSDQRREWGALCRASLRAGATCLPGYPRHILGPVFQPGALCPPPGRLVRRDARPALPLLCPGWDIWSRVLFVRVSGMTALGGDPLDYIDSCDILCSSACHRHRAAGGTYFPCGGIIALVLANKAMREGERQGRGTGSCLPGAYLPPSGHGWLLVWCLRKHWGGIATPLPPVDQSIASLWGGSWMVTVRLYGGI